jgi:NTP pyrophosphatase (non-canonical NTP hydrolase)
MEVADMAEKSDVELYKQCIKKFGAMNQILMVMEESGELLKALNKFNRGQASEPQVWEALVDMWIMLEQMMVLFKLDLAEFKRLRKVKLDRLEQFMKTGKWVNVKSSGSA